MRVEDGCEGLPAEMASVFNQIVARNEHLASELQRVRREVVRNGRLDERITASPGQGSWATIADAANQLMEAVVSPVSHATRVLEAVAAGDLTKRVDLHDGNRALRGDLRLLGRAVNRMVDQLSLFTGQLMQVAREVGIEGQLGGRARVHGVSGMRKRLTASVNELASNLTTQVRAITEVASAVTQGGLSRSISVEARGKTAGLKNNVNLMVANLRETTRAMDRLESNLTRIAALMQGHRDLVEVADLILSELTPLVNAQFGAFFLARADVPPGEDLEFIAGYGTRRAGRDGRLPGPEAPGHGLIAQAAVGKKRILVEGVPPDYFSISSGIGSASTVSVVIQPILVEDQVLGVIKLASFSKFSDVHLAFLDQFANTIGVSINTIIANSRTESPLLESQRLTTELRQRSDELQNSNAGLEDKAALLATASRYRSEFLANMSHELRTPLNSLLILAQLLADNRDGHLSDQEVYFAATIHRAGSDLLQLINDIHDLSEIEAGRMDAHPGKLPLTRMLDYVQATFRPLAIDRDLTFEIAVGEDVPRELYSDEQRLQQILRNLLSNALKFTSTGGVELRVERVTGEPFEEETLRSAGTVLAFSVKDTGIGIASEKLAVISEAFRQSDGTTSRRYGGTGLGLSVSREIAGLLGGRIVAESGVGAGSRFTLYVPARLPAAHRVAETAVPAECPAEPAPPDATGYVPSGAYGNADGLAGTQAPGTPDDSWPGMTRLKEWLTGRPGQILPGRRILIADDNIRNVFALTHVLGRIGISVRYAETGREALDVLHRHPDLSLVLMDIMMPEMDGYETIRAIRSDPRLARLPVIALTAKAMPGDREKAIEAGASDYVPKPVDIDHLLSVICGQLGPQGGSPSGSPPGARKPGTPGDEGGNQPGQQP